MIIGTNTGHEWKIETNENKINWINSIISLTKVKLPKYVFDTNSIYSFIENFYNNEKNLNIMVDVVFATFLRNQKVSK